MQFKVTQSLHFDFEGWILYETFYKKHFYSAIFSFLYLEYSIILNFSPALYYFRNDTYYFIYNSIKSAFRNNRENNKIATTKNKIKI